MTVHAPQPPSLHPSLVPVKPTEEMLRPTTVLAIYLRFIWLKDNHEWLIGNYATMRSISRFARDVIGNRVS